MNYIENTSKHPNIMFDNSIPSTFESIKERLCAESTAFRIGGIAMGILGITLVGSVAFCIATTVAAPLTIAIAGFAVAFFSTIPLILLTVCARDAIVTGNNAHRLAQNLKNDASIDYKVEGEKIWKGDKFEKDALIHEGVWVYRMAQD